MTTKRTDARTGYHAPRPRSPKVDLLPPLRALVRWATHGNKHGNPYMVQEVTDALRAIKAARRLPNDFDYLDANDGQTPGSTERT